MRILIYEVGQLILVLFGAVGLWKTNFGRELGDFSATLIGSFDHSNIYISQAVKWGVLSC